MTTNQDHTTMIKEFRVLTIPMDTMSCDTTLLKELFGVDNPVNDTVDTLPPQTALGLVGEAGWTPIVTEAINMGTHLCVPYVK